MKNIQLITSNPEKVKEYVRYAHEFGISTFFTLRSIDIPELQSSDPDEVLESKITWVKGRTNLPFLVEDTIFTTERYPRFPGINVKLFNEVLGIDGWKRLCDEGDGIKGITRLALHYLGQTHYFIGELEGTISFKHTELAKGRMPINHLFFIPKRGAFLGDLLEDASFQNHRKKAASALFEFLKKSDAEEAVSIDETSKRWSERADSWDSFLKDPTSYVNHEDGYARFQKVLEKLLPAISGNVLDVGCGTGGVTAHIASSSSAQFLGIDVSEGMIREAQKKERVNLQFRCSTIDSLDPIKKFDFLFSRGVVLAHVPHTSVIDFLINMDRVAAVGAYLVIDFIQNVTNGQFSSKHPLNELSLEILKGIMAELGWVHVDGDGNQENRVRIAVFHKYSDDGIYFATGNPLKMQELASAAAHAKRRLYFYGVEIDEIKSDIIEKIVEEKLRHAYALIKRPVLCTDGGIFIDCLKGFPGENSKQAAKKLGAEGIIKLLNGETNRKAIRRNCIGYYDGERMKTFTAEVECIISDVPRAAYQAYELDKILIPVSFENAGELTYAEMPVEERVQYTELPKLAKFIETL